MTAPFWHAQPDTVRAVIEIAQMRQAERDDMHDLVLAAFLDPHAETVRDIWRKLQAIDLLIDDPARAVRQTYGPAVRVIDADRLAYELRCQYAADVVFMAQTVAQARALAGAA